MTTLNYSPVVHLFSGARDGLGIGLGICGTEQVFPTMVYPVTDVLADADCEECLSRHNSDNYPGGVRAGSDDNPAW